MLVCYTSFSGSTYIPSTSSADCCHAPVIFVHLAASHPDDRDQQQGFYLPSRRSDPFDVGTRTFLVHRQPLQAESQTKYCIGYWIRWLIYQTVSDRGSPGVHGS